MARVSVVIPVKARNEDDVKWTRECLRAIQVQTYRDVEIFLVNDHSPQDLRGLKDVVGNDRRTTAMMSKGHGVSAARNTGVEASSGELLLAVDHDDYLPRHAISRMVGVWDGEGKTCGIVYPDTVSFGIDFRKEEPAPRYTFRQLLQTMFMPIGSLHRVKDNRTLGGWREDMEAGLEDWEFWLRMGEEGIWGYHLDEPLYYYRRHPRGRLAFLRSHEEAWNKAYAQMRSLHAEYFNGKEPKVCRGCGGGRRRVVPAARQQAAARALVGTMPRGTQREILEAAAIPAGNLVQVIYRGSKEGNFFIKGPSGMRYEVTGKNGPLWMKDGRRGVLRQDLNVILAQDGGAFEVASS